MLLKAYFKLMSLFDEGRINEFFSWRGRLNRLSFFLRMLAISAFGTLVTDIPEAYGIELSTPVVLFVLLISAILGAFQITKRLHDFDQSGWLQLLSLIPAVNFGLGLYLLFKKGDEYENKYGKDPLLARSVGKLSGRPELT